VAADAVILRFFFPIHTGCHRDRAGSEHHRDEECASQKTMHRHASSLPTLGYALNNAKYRRIKLVNPIPHQWERGWHRGGRDIPMVANSGGSGA